VRDANTIAWAGQLDPRPVWDVDYARDVQELRDMLKRWTQQGWRVFSVMCQPDGVSAQFVVVVYYEESNH
jgi:hypothetical protein